MGGRADFGRVQGRIAHDETDGQDPVSIGGQAQSASPTAVSSGDVVRGWWSPIGELHVITNSVGGPFAPNATQHGMQSVALVSPADTTILGAPGTGKSYRLSSVYASNVNPTYSLSMNLRDGTATMSANRLRFDGGGYVWSWEPRGHYLTTNTALKGNIDITMSSVIVNVLFDVVDTPTS